MGSAKNVVRAAVIACCIGWAATAHATPQPVRIVEKRDDGVMLHTDAGVLRLQVWGERVVRVHFVPTNAKARGQSMVVNAKPQPVAWQPVDQEKIAGIKTSKLEVRVDKQTGAVAFLDSEGKAFLSESADGGRESVVSEIAGRSVRGTAQSFQLPDDEAIFGLGQQQEGVMNYVGHTVHLQQINTKTAIPVLMSSKGYVLLWDNPAVTDVDVGKSNKGILRWASEANEDVDYYVCYGPELDQAVAGYRMLSGAAPMMGKWVWGYWQSRERYASQQQVLDVAAEYRRKKIPIDGIIQDWMYWDPHPWGSHQFGPAYPDPAGMMKQLHEMNFHAIISVWPKFDQGSKNFNELKTAGFLYPQDPKNPYTYYDAFNADARAMYWRQMSEQIFSKGFDGWWLDATEPELNTRWGELRGYATGAGPGYDVINAYPLQTTTAVYNGQRSETSDKRVMILTRSAFAGQQRNATIAWSGDIAGDWATFKKQVPAGLNFVASGIPYWNTDIGGFFSRPNTDPEYRELFARWFQFGAFCPMFRSHGTGTQKEMWSFGPEIEKVLVKYNELRYRLLPYIYSQSWQVTHASGTMMRPLVMDFTNDPKVLSIPDQFMFGPAIMVCPVLQPATATLSVIQAENFIDQDGRPGALTAAYFDGRNFERQVLARRDGKIDFEWDKTKREGVGAEPRKDPIPGLSMDAFSARWSGSIRTRQAGAYTFQLRADDGMRLWVNDKLLIDDWNSRPAATKSAKINLPADAVVPIRVEYYQNDYEAQIELRWQPPSDEKPEVVTRSVYLPAGQWRDFWTGKLIEGGQSITVPAPLDHLPLFVRPGAILPLGPVVQHANEQPDAPIELRVYRGADGAFTLYDDAGDGYGYEKGEHATIPIRWNEHDQQLTIGDREGRYPGMAETRVFKIVWVRPGHGGGAEIVPTADRDVVYTGKAISVKPEVPATE